MLHKTLGGQVDGGDDFVRAQDLSRLQHDGLRDSLLIVKRFKERISYHFRLDAF